MYCHLNMKYIRDCTFFLTARILQYFKAVYTPLIWRFIARILIAAHPGLYTGSNSFITNWFVMCKGNNLENTGLAESVTRWIQWQSWTGRVDFINIQGKISLTVSFGMKLIVQHWKMLDSDIYTYITYLFIGVYSPFTNKRQNTVHCQNRVFKDLLDVKVAC